GDDADPSRLALLTRSEGKDDDGEDEATHRFTPPWAPPGVGHPAVPYQRKRKANPGSAFAAASERRRTPRMTLCVETSWPPDDAPRLLRNIPRTFACPLNPSDRRCLDDVLRSGEREEASEKGDTSAHVVEKDHQSQHHDRDPRARRSSPA